jgi:hypothetical protein
MDERPKKKKKKNKKRFEEFQGQSTEKNPKNNLASCQKNQLEFLIFFKKKFDVDVKFAYIKFQIKLFDVKIRFFQEWEESKEKKVEKP